MKRILLVCFLLCTWCMADSAMAQYSIKGLSLTDANTSWFDKQIGSVNNEIITGVDGSYKLISNNTHPFFQQRDWSLGEIKYRNEIFTDVLLKYDLQRDLLIISNPAGGAPIKINQSQISWFKVDGHLFKSTKSKDGQIASGFYDVIYASDEFSLLVKRVKVTGIQDNKDEYIANNRYYIKILSDYHKVSSGNSIAGFFKSEKKQVKSYLKSNGIKKLENASVQQLIGLSDFCRNLTSPQ